MPVNDLRKTGRFLQNEVRFWRRSADTSSMKNKDYPIKIRKGNVVVTIYRTLIADKERFKVHYFDNDQAKSKAFSDPEAADKHAAQIAEKLNRNEFNPLVFSTADRDEYVTALQYLKPSGISLIIAASTARFRNPDRPGAL
jgi:hypothetical protein